MSVRLRKLCFTLFLALLAFGGTLADEAAWERANRAGAQAYQRGDYPEAARWLTEALKEAEKFDAEHPIFAAALNNLAGLYRAQGRHAEADPLYRRALAIAEKALGPEHPHVATSLNNLAGLYRAQGRYAEAESLLQRSRAIREKQR